MSPRDRVLFYVKGIQEVARHRHDYVSRLRGRFTGLQAEHRVEIRFNHRVKLWPGHSAR